MKITVYKEPTEFELELIKKANEILAEGNLELVGTRPRDRE